MYIYIIFVDVFPSGWVPLAHILSHPVLLLPLLTDRQITLSHIMPHSCCSSPCYQTDRLYYTCSYSVTPRAAPPPVNGQTDYTCSYFATYLAAPPPVNGQEDYTCSYYTKTFCHTPCRSSLLLIDGQKG